MRARAHRWLAALLWLLACGASAQVDKPVKILVGFAAGGSADIAARLLAERMQGDLKQPVLVDNKPGAGGRIAAEALKNAPPDGGTLMLAPIVVPVLAPLVYSRLSYDPVADFAPVARVADFQFGLSVNAANPIRSVSELVTWSKFNAPLASYGTPAPGSLPHFFGVQIAKATGVDYVHVPFNGGAPAMNALIGNQVGFVIDTVVDGIEMHRAGKTRMIATSGA
ncbi:MAG TPA: tripartite tricarboxylate transporter substrate-binding protein, partial [Burkholderiaceae bacterium]|nr:tripartite tricarboxylate transporter substrate-binding protein [Burkholderiaceae bacterium]